MGRTRTKAEKRARKLRKASHAGTGRLPDSFEVRYGSPEALQLIGPLIWATWSVPEALASRLRADGRPVPSPVPGRMLVDTGATATSISMEAANELGLHAIDVGRTYGAHGLQENPVFHAHLAIVIQRPHDGATTGVESDLRVAGIRDMEAMFATMGVKTGDRDGGRLIGLLGRDFLRHAILTYDGPRGVVRIEVALHSLPGGAPRTTAT